MPAFQLSQQSPGDLLQLCGVKRRAESLSQVDYQCDRPNYDLHSSPKRICLCSEEGPDCVANALPLNENNRTETSCSVNHPHQPVIIFGANNDMVQPMQQLHRDGETLSVAGVTAELQLIDSMEVDCNVTGEHQMPYEQTLMDFGSTRSPAASGLLRCYCRPSWDGMVEMQQQQHLYRSDCF